MLKKGINLSKNYIEGFVYGILPTSEPSILPRAKVIPTRRNETRWEKFAKEKGE